MLVLLWCHQNGLTIVQRPFHAPAYIWVVNPVYPNTYTEPSLADIEGYAGEDYFTAPYSQEYSVCVENPNETLTSTIDANVALVRNILYTISSVHD